MSGAPLSEWILGTERPLSYLREADPDQRIRTRLPVASWLEKIAGLEDPPAEALELGELFRRLDDGGGIPGSSIARWPWSGNSAGEMWPTLGFRR